MIDTTTEKGLTTMFGIRSSVIAAAGIAGSVLVAPAIQSIFTVPMSSVIPIATWSVFGAMQVALVLIAATGVLTWARSKAPVAVAETPRELTETERLHIELQTSAPVDSSEIVETQNA